MLPDLVPERNPGVLPGSSLIWWDGVGLYFAAGLRLFDAVFLVVFFVAMVPVSFCGVVATPCRV